MAALEESPTRKCYGCGGELRPGLRFCVRCGTNNFDADAGRLAEAECEMKSHGRISAINRFIYWWRYITTGIRR